MPYLAEKCMDMLYNILAQTADSDTPLKSIGGDMYMDDFQKMLIAGSGNAQVVEGMSDKDIVKLKVGSIGRMRRMYKNLVENQDLLLQIKMVNDGRIPRGLLLEGKLAIRNALKEFELASTLDKENEKRPIPRGSIVRSSPSLKPFKD